MFFVVNMQASELPINVNISEIYESVIKKRCLGYKKDQNEQMFIDGKTICATCSNC